MRPRSLFSRSTVRDDALSGLVLGVESVPDGLASGLLAGVNPVAGLYGYLFGMVGGALFTSSTYMAIQCTGAMSIIVADVHLADRHDPTRALFTLSMLTGVVMIVAGALKLGTLLRFVSKSVLTGFVAAVGINIVLGQLTNFTGYAADGANRIARTLNLLFHFWEIDVPTLTVGVVTVVLILVLERTRLGALGLVVAIAIGSGLAAVFIAFDHAVALVGDIADVPRGLPTPQLPVLRDIPALLLPAASLAFVGLVQGAGVSAGFPNAGGVPADASQDFIGQGAGNVVAGLFQGMPVGGSMSASSLIVSAGAKTRSALLFAGVTMAVVMIAFVGVVKLVAMPALAGLLIVIGCRTVKPAKLVAVARTGPVSLTVMVITLVLTLLIPLQYAVLVGVGLSVLLFVIGQSSALTTRRIEFRDDGKAVERTPPEELAAGDVVVLQPYGPVFFATADVLRRQMPTVTAQSRHAVVILRLRGGDEAGVTVLDVLGTYSAALAAVDSRLVIVTDNRRLIEQIDTAGLGDRVRVYAGTEVVGETTRRAYDDAVDWVGA